MKFATLYFYLNEKALCHLHYEKYIDGLLHLNEADQPEVLDELRGMGLEINSIEDLKTRDPFEAIKLTLQAKRNKK